MKGFHLDFNTAHFTKPYLEGWLKRLAQIGYDTIVWEVEAAVKWDTCPECADRDAFTKTQFSEILDLAQNLGLESIPLLQVLGHCEYVLKHDKYRNLAEAPGSIKQYCPSNPDVFTFLCKWIDEYFDLFGKIKYFHLGADEASELAKCNLCKNFADSSSVSELYIKYINSFELILSERNTRPVIWADMILDHYESIANLSRDFVIFDWMYDNSTDGRIWVWNKGFVTKEALPTRIMSEFGKYLFPSGNFDQPKAYYASDYLADKGFDVVVCPAASCYGDSVFFPRNRYHLKNVCDAFKKGAQNHLKGSVLTSWTVHLFPFELQLPCIDAVGYLKYLDEFNEIGCMGEFAGELFDDDMYVKDFISACDLLSKPCAFSSAARLGYAKDNLPVKKEFVLEQLENFTKAGQLEQMRQENCTLFLEYKLAYELLCKLPSKNDNCKKILDWYILASENLINRALGSVCLFDYKLNNTITKTQVLDILKDLILLKIKTSNQYFEIIKSERRELYIHWMYDSFEYALKYVEENLFNRQ